MLVRIQPTLPYQLRGIMAKSVGGVRLRGRGRSAAGSDDFTRQHWSGEGIKVERRNSRMRNGPIIPVNDRIKGVFGRDLSDNELASLVGAPNDSEVIVKVGSEGFSVTVISPWVHADRMFKLGPDGIETGNTFLFLQEGAPRGQGIGVRMFARQVKEARRLGITKILTEAGRSKAMNGYYTWARAGYDAPLGAGNKSRAAQALGYMPKTIREVMSTKAGRDWWKENGTEWEGSFDPSAGSNSSKDLDAYLSEKGIRV